MTTHRDDRAEMIADAIAMFTSVYGHPPTIRQIADRVGLASPSAVSHHLRTLMDAGLVEKCGCGCRSYWLVAA